jgi:hypothetical protein
MVSGCVSWRAECAPQARAQRAHGPARTGQGRAAAGHLRPGLQRLPRVVCASCRSWPDAGMGNLDHAITEETTASAKTRTTTWGPVRRVRRRVGARRAWPGSSGSASHSTGLDWTLIFNRRHLQRPAAGRGRLPRRFNKTPRLHAESDLRLPELVRRAAGRSSCSVEAAGEALRAVNAGGPPAQAVDRLPADVDCRRLPPHRGHRRPLEHSPAEHVRRPAVPAESHRLAAQTPQAHASRGDQIISS